MVDVLERHLDAKLVDRLVVEALHPARGHARGEVSAEALALRSNGNTAALSFAPGWVDTHPRTLYLLGEEAEAWQRSAPLKLTLRH